MQAPIPGSNHHMPLPLSSPVAHGGVAAQKLPACLKTWRELRVAWEGGATDLGNIGEKKKVIHVGWSLQGKVG